MSDFLNRASEFVLQLLAGGTMEIVLLIVLVLVALVLLVLAAWVLWKLLVALGKGALWAGSRGNTAWRERSAARSEARAGAPPGVSTGWSASGRMSLRAALMEARRLTDGDALRIVIVDGDGGTDLCRGLDLSPPGAGSLRLAAGGDVVLIDASAATRRDFRRLAGALSWRRPLDAIAVLADAEGIPREAISRAAALARAIGMRTAVHFVLPSASKAAAWRVIDANSGDAGQVTADLGGDTVRQWLGGGTREGLDRLALAQSGGLPAALDRARAVAPSGVLDVASLSFGGAGLRGAVAQTLERTRPAAAPGFWTWASLGVFVVGALLAALAATVSVDRSLKLQAAVQAASREAAVPWSAEGIPTVPSASRMRHIAEVARRLSDLSSFSLLTPLAPFVPNASAPRELASTFLDSYLLRPLAAALERDAVRRLAPRDEPQEWIDDARVVGGWFTAWEGLADDPREVDVQVLLSDAFGGARNSWPDGIGEALHEVGTMPPLPGEGGLDVDGLTEYARTSFIATMQRWADSVYTNGPVATAARRASDRSAAWRAQHDALLELRTALQDPSQQWLTAAEDKPDHAFELRMLGQTVGLVLVGQVTVLEAKAAISAIRIAARDAAEYFILPAIGPLMARAGEGGGPSLVMSAGASAWLGFLDRIANAGFAEPPAASVTPPIGPVLLDLGAVAEARRRLQVFDQFAANLPAGLPPAVAQDLVRQLAAELTIGVTADVENALRLENDIGTPITRAERRARMAPALDHLDEIEGWLRQRQADGEADRVTSARARVAGTVLAAAADVIADEDPVGVPFDPTVDGDALVRRFDRGLSRVRAIHEQFGAPFIDAAREGDSWAAVDWRRMAEDIEAHARGDADSALSIIEGTMRAFADDPEAACEAPRAAGFAARSDYLSRSVTRLMATMGRVCGERREGVARDVYDRIATYFNAHVAWQWPYANDRMAPEVNASTLSAFLEELAPFGDLTTTVDEPLVSVFSESLAFWTVDDNGAASVRFGLDWRTRPEDEVLAENVAEIQVIGADPDASGIRTWNYGTPFSIRLRLADNSAWRFVRGEVETDDWFVQYTGSGSLLRFLDGVGGGGAVTIEAEVADGLGNLDLLRLTGRVSQGDGRPLQAPSFAVPPPDTAASRGNLTRRGAPPAPRAVGTGPAGQGATENRAKAGGERG
ncbi:MAG: hypothetical protein F4Y26_18745 [Gammaproteobacteria bacterium]|nr:hypothetical protein [Gammaproteobacteria bacterium]